MCAAQRELHSFGDSPAPLITQRDGVWLSDGTEAKVEKLANPFKGTRVQLLITFTDLVFDGDEERAEREFRELRPEDILLSIKCLFFGSLTLFICLFSFLLYFFLSPIILSSFPSFTLFLHLSSSLFISLHSPSPSHYFHSSFPLSPPRTAGVCVPCVGCVGASPRRGRAWHALSSPHHTHPRGGMRVCALSSLSFSFFLSLFTHTSHLLFICPFIHSFNYSFVHLFIHSSIHPIIHPHPPHTVPTVRPHPLLLILPISDGTPHTATCGGGW